MSFYNGHYDKANMMKEWDSNKWAEMIRSALSSDVKPLFLNPVPYIRLGRWRFPLFSQWTWDRIIQLILRR
jgi:hypothetical protein